MEDLIHPKVQSIDSFDPPNGGATQYTVNYHYGFDLPGWANTPEMKTAFPRIALVSNTSATATLVESGGNWQVQNVNPASTAVGGQ